LPRFDLEHTFRPFEAGHWPDHPQDPRPGCRRSVDLADHQVAWRIDLGRRSVIIPAGAIMK
jgi:hypothetical protein